MKTNHFTILQLVLILVVFHVACKLRVNRTFINILHSDYRLLAVRVLVMNSVMA